MSAVFCKDTYIKTRPQQGALTVPENCKKADLVDINLVIKGRLQENPSEHRDWQDVGFHSANSVIKANPQDKPYELSGCKEVSVVTLKTVLGRMYRKFKQLYFKNINTIAEFAQAKVQVWVAMFSSDLVVSATKAGLLGLGPECSNNE